MGQWKRGRVKQVFRTQIEPYAPCVCGSEKKMKFCHWGEQLERFIQAVHECGHFVIVPPDAVPHSNYDNPCKLCGEEGDALPGSMAHTGYGKEVDLSNFDHIAYAMAGGAAEVASGCPCEMRDFGFGLFPSSMEQDLIDLEQELSAPHRNCWNEAVPWLHECYEVCVKHFKESVPEIKALAIQLSERGALNGGEVDCNFARRDALVGKIECLLGEPTPDGSEEL
jgi:hypothetical protein